jgi:hypothetical protein
MQLDVIPNRPLLAAFQLLPHAMFGGDPRPQLALALVLAVLVSTCFFHLLRKIGVPALAAATVGVLVLLFPWSDSIRLWPEASINQVAVILYLLGAIAAFWGLRSSGWRAALIHLCACALFAASVLTYEATGAVALATGLLYFAFSSRRRALLAWGANIVVVGAAIAWSAGTTPRPVAFGHSQWANAVQMARGAASVTAHAVFPVVGANTWVVAALLVVIAAAILVAFFGKDRQLASEVRRLLNTLGAATVGIGLSYVMFIPVAYWAPQRPTLENRVNLVAALPISLFVYTFVALIALLALSSVRWAPGLRIGLISLATLALAAAYGVRLHDDQGTWSRAYAAERGVLATLREVLPHPRAGTTILTFGTPAQVAPRLPVFYEDWDLNGAAQFIYRDGSLNAYPVFSGAQFKCDAAGVTPFLPTPSSFHYLDPRVNGQQLPLHYGSVIFVDIIGRRTHSIASPRQCLEAVRQFRPGAVESPSRLRIITARSHSYTSSG